MFYQKLIELDQVFEQEKKNKKNKKKEIIYHDILN